MSIEEKEDALFARWKEHHRACLDNYCPDLFCSDGLHFLGKAIWDGSVYTMEGDHSEEAKWNESFIRPLFLTKDHNLRGDGEGVDVRAETGLDNDFGNLYYRFYKKLLLIVYGLYEISLCGNDRDRFLELKETISPHSLTHRMLLEVFHREFAVARMNLKKIAGNSACSDAELQIAIYRDFDFIKEQIAIYKPNVIVCCHGGPRDSNPIMQLLLKLYPDLERQTIEGYNCQFIYWSEREQVIVIHEWHPSCRGISNIDYFEAIPQLIDFLTTLL